MMERHYHPPLSKWNSCSIDIEQLDLNETTCRRLSLKRETAIVFSSLCVSKTMPLHRLDTFKHDLKHGQDVCNLLTQILVLAEDTKRQVVPQDVKPLSLIDLIQASYLIFERNKIEPPEDAVYHRYLLALSINPERDWRTKIAYFDLDYPPKHKPFCSQSAINDYCSSLDKDARKRHQSLQKHHLVRQASQSIRSKSDNSSANPTPKRRPQRDHFNDLLSLDSPIQRLSVNPKKPPNAFTNLPIDMNTKAHWLPKKDMHSLPPSKEQWQATQAVNEPEHQSLWHVKTLFKAWHHNTQRHKSFRIQRLVRQQAAVLETAFQCLQRWRLYLEMTKCAKDRQQWVYQRQQRARLRLVLRHWRRLFEWKQQEVQGEKHYARHSKRKVLTSWQQLSKLKREVQYHGSRARRKRCFLHWQRGIERKHATRALLCTCLDQRRLRTLSTLWTHLRGHVFESQTARTRWNLWVEAGRFRSHQTAFQYWKQSVIESKAVRERLQEVRQSFQYRVLDRHFQVWATWAKRRKMGDLIIDTMTIARAHKQLQWWFEKWQMYRDVIRDQTTMRVRIVACFRRQRIWQPWRKATGVRMATYCLNSAYRLHLLTIHWHVLVRNRHVQRQKERAATAFQAEHTMKRKQQGFSAWQSHSCRKRVLQSRQDQLHHQSHRHSVLLRSWRHWRRRFGTRTKARLADLHHDRNHKVSTFRLWKQGMVHGRLRRERSVEWVQRRTTCHVHACFRQWKWIIDEHQKRIAQAQSVQEMVGRTLVLYRWTMWKSALETKRTERSRLLSIVLTWQRRQKHATFQRWRTRWGLRKRHQKLLERMASTSKRRDLKRQFHAWRITCQIILASERQYRRIQDKRLRFIAKRAIHQWNCLRLEHMNDRVKIKHFQAHLSQSVLSNAFTSLFTFTQTRKFAKRRTLVAKTRSCTQLVQKAWKVWSKYTRNHQLRMQQCQAAQRHLDALKLLGSLQTLRRNARVKAQATATYARIVSRRFACVKAIAFSNWKAYSTRKHRNRQEAAAFRYFYVLPLHFQHWKAFRTNAKDKRARRFQAWHGGDQQRKKRAFNAWLLHVIRCRRTKEDVRNFKKRQSIRRWQHFHFFSNKTDQDQVLAIRWYQRSLCFRSVKQWSVITRYDRVSRTWAQRTVHKAFSVWLEHVQRLHRMQHHVHSLWRQKVCQKGVTQWKHFTRLCQFNRQRQARVLYHRIHQWRQFTTRDAHSRQWARLVSDHVRLRCLQQRWSFWRSRAHKLRCVRALSSKSTRLRVTSNLERQFHQWKRYTALSRALNTFKRRQALQTMRRMFHHGFQHFHEVKVKHQTVTKAIQQVHKAFLKDWLRTRVQDQMTRIAAAETFCHANSSLRFLRASWTTWRAFHVQKQRQQRALRQLCARIARSRAIESTRLCGMLRRWKLLEKVRGFERWGRGIQTQKRTRAHRLRALKWWLGNLSRRSFCRWKRFYHLQKIHQRVCVIHQTATFKRRWQCWWNAIVRKQSLALELDRVHFQYLGRTFLQRWRHARGVNQSQREQMLALYHSSRLELLAALVHQWQTIAINKKRKRLRHTIARLVATENLVHHTFLTWKTTVRAIVASRHHWQLSVQRGQTRLLCSCFCAWRFFTHYHMKVRRLMDERTTERQRLVCCHVMTKWHWHVKTRRALQSHFASFVRFRRLQQGVVQLREFKQEQRTHHRWCRDVHAFQRAAERKSVLKRFGQWRRVVFVLRQSRQFKRHYDSTKRLPAVWQGWMAFLKRRRERQAQLCTATWQWQQRTMRTAWQALGLVLKHHRARQTMFIKAVEQYRIRRLTLMLMKWWQWHGKQQHLRACCAMFQTRSRLQTMKRCCNVLANYALTVQSLHKHETTVRARQRTSTLRKGWKAWQKIWCIVRRGRRQQIHRSWTFWRQGHDLFRRIQTMQVQRQATNVKRCQRLCFIHWIRYKTRRKRGKFRHHMSIGFARTHLLQRIWHQWQQFADAHQRIRAQRCRAGRFMHVYYQRRAVRRLETFQRMQKQTWHGTMLAHAFYSYQRYRKYFVEWRTTATRWRIQRQTLDALSQVMTRCMHRKKFRAWRGVVAQRRVWRQVVAQALVAQTHEQRYRFFKAWHLVVTQVLATKRANGFYRLHVSTRVLTSWKRYVDCKTRKRVEKARNVCRLESIVLSWRQAVGVKQQVRQFRVKVARRQRLERMKTSFLGWKRGSHIERTGRTLLVRVAGRIRVHYRFRLWTRFTAYCNRLATLELMSADSVSIQTRAQPTGIDNGQSKVHVTASNTDHDRQLVALGDALRQKARFFQQVDVVFELPQAWHWWRQLYHAHLFYRMRNLQTHFSLWQQFAYSIRQNRLILSKLTRRRQELFALSNFQAWAHLVAHVKQFQKDRLRDRNTKVLVATATQRRERRQLTQHWRAWQFHVKKSRHLQTSLKAYYRARLLMKFWVCWSYDYRQIMTQKRRKIESINLQMRVFYLRRTIQKLGACQQWAKRSRLILKYFTKRRHNTFLAKVITRWSQRCNLDKKVTHFFAIVSWKKIRRYFTEWRGSTLKQKWQRFAVGNFYSKRLKMRRRHVWRHWRHQVAIQSTKKFALQTATMFYIRTNVRKRWRRYTQCVRQYRVQDERIYTKLCVFHGRRAIMRWRNFSRTRHLRCLYQRFVLQKHMQLWQFAVKNAMAMRFYTNLQRAKAKTIILLWQQVAIQRQNWRQVCKTFAIQKAMKTTYQGFLQWQHFVVARQGARMAAMHVRLRLVQTIWRWWKQRTVASRLQRYEQFKQAVRFSRRVMGRNSLRTWQARVKIERERRFLLLSCIIKLESVANQRVLQRVFQSWKRSVNLKRRCEAAVIKREHKVAKKFFVFWLRWSRGRQRRRQKLSHVAMQHSQHIKSVVFLYWQTYTLAWKDATKPCVTLHERQLTALK